MLQNFLQTEQEILDEKLTEQDVLDFDCRSTALAGMCSDFLFRMVGERAESTREIVGRVEHG